MGGGGVNDEYQNMHLKCLSLTLLEDHADIHQRNNDDDDIGDNLQNLCAFHC
jgi:hypothetical protein